MIKILNKIYTKIQILPSINNINKNINKNINAKNVIISYFNWKYSKNCLISNIVIIEINNKVQIQFFYYITNNQKFINKFNKSNNKNNKTENKIISENNNNISIIFVKNLSKILQNIFGKKVELIINKVHYPYINAKIFSEYLCKNVKTKTFLHFTQSISSNYFAKNLPSHIIGIKITLHGRLITEQIIPRKTIKSKILGRFNNYTILNNSQLWIDKGYTEIKNELGTFRINVEIAQSCFKLLFYIFFIFLFSLFFNFKIL